MYSPDVSSVVSGPTTVVGDGDGDDPSQMMAQTIVGYIDTRTPSLHPAFAVEGTFNNNSVRYEETSVRQRYVEFLRQYEESEETPGFEPSNCPWDVVLEELGKAWEAAADSETRTKDLGFAFITKCRRRIGRISKVIAPALDAFPDELGPLRGGLALIFSLARHREQNRQAILDTFEDIPEIIGSALSKAKNFPADENLFASIEHLKSTLYKAIPVLVRILKPKGLWPKLKGPFLESDIKVELDQIRRAADRVESCANDVRDAIAVKTYHNTEVIRKAATATGWHVEEVERSMSSISRGVSELNDHNAQLQAHVREMDRNQTRVVQQLTDALASKNELFKMLQGVFLKLELLPEKTSDSAGSPALEASHELVEQHLRNVLGVLRVPQGHDIHDLAFTLKQSHAPDSGAVGLGGAVLRSSQFQRWLSGSASSDLILVEAHLDPSTFGKTSPISYFSANLVKVVRRKGVILHFFCGQHLASNDPLKGPAGLIRSLVTQLLDALIENGVAKPNELLQLALPSGECTTEDLAQLLIRLLGHVLAPTTVFVVLDDVSRFERPSWENDYWGLMSTLQRAMGTMSVKVLLTSSTKSAWLRDTVPQDQRVELWGGGSEIGEGTEAMLWGHAGATM